MAYGINNYKQKDKGESIFQKTHKNNNNNLCVKSLHKQRNEKLICIKVNVMSSDD